MLDEHDLSAGDGTALLTNVEFDWLGLIEPSLWAVAMAERHADMMSAQLPAGLKASLQQLRTFFVRALGLIPFLPGVDDATLDALLAEDA